MERPNQERPLHNDDPRRVLADLAACLLTCGRLPLSSTVRAKKICSDRAQPLTWDTYYRTQEMLDNKKHEIWSGLDLFFDNF